MNYYLGVDVGTSSVKSLLMDSEGKTVGTSQIGYDIIKEKLQYAEQDMEKLWEATKETLCQQHPDGGRPDRHPHDLGQLRFRH